ncbi:MAG TPA: sodium:proton antiporter [Pseudonocardiaceae bacterium]|nr:sodium:proton antiporter [Pseudonocardiaceae bacterium]
MSSLPYLVAGWLFLVGCYGLITSRDLVHAVVCLSVTQSATYVLLLAVGFRAGGTAPVFSDIPADIPVRTRVVDPVVQALTLTDIVVSATVTAVLLALTIQIHKRHGTVDPDELRALRD